MARRVPRYTDTLAEIHGGRWTFKHKRWTCDDGRRYVSCSGNLFDDKAPPTYHLYGDGKPRIIAGPIAEQQRFDKAQEPELQE